MVTKVPSVELLGEANEKSLNELVIFSYQVCHKVDVIGIVMSELGAAAMEDNPVFDARSVA